MDYSGYSHDDLLRRVTDLEAQLRALNAKHTVSNTSSPAPPKKKPKKAPKPFDPSRYNTRHIALKFAYLGSGYNGFEHHLNNATPLPTIEETLWKALMKTKLIFPDFQGKSEDEVCWEGVDYSKCGRTDRGVSAFGQVVGLSVRSAKPKAKVKSATEITEETVNGEEVKVAQPPGDHIKDELPYIQVLNRVLPSDIRILAWCPDPPPSPLDPLPGSCGPPPFSARFNCQERRYRYFFTNPAFALSPTSREGWLNIDAMQKAANKYAGLHDFRNLCKIDPSKQITNWERRIFHAGIHEVSKVDGIGLYYFEVRGSAFLWHQVRHLVAVLFLVGQGYEKPEIVDQLLDVQSCPGKPIYDMASDAPLVLWDCIFPDLQSPGRAHVDDTLDHGHEDAMNWIYVGDEAGGRDTSKRVVPGVDDGKYGRNGIMDELWALWRKRKMDEVLAHQLINVVKAQGTQSEAKQDAVNGGSGEPSDRVFDGSERPRAVGTYIPIMQREKMETPDVVNARYAARKGLEPKQANRGAVDAEMDE
ncbi:tRNA pseudouridine(38/39) synthase [Teratosphaeria destructans]|uniref:tRNA pseudouridine(38/39) synthase n=1 Tax=Teratosphaeria destructans TaxID=418781 RepID=A0A9W7W147_9PEZI|nr:tRNA pseudouridine(38/39) synthase [Teratosphaeria destructans]